MAEINFSCPQCDVALQVEEEWAGQAIECPNCAAQVTVPEIQNEEESEEAAIEEEEPPAPSRKPSKKQYIWGRLYICFSGILAVFVLVAALGFFVWNGYQTARDIKLKGLYPDPADAAALVGVQNDFLKKYDDTINLLSTRHEGISYFGASLSALPNVAEIFNEQLNTPERVQQSIDTLAKYQSNIQKMKEIFQGFFRKELAKVEREFPSTVAAPVPRKQGMPKRTRGITSNITSVSSFYSPGSVMEKRDRLKDYLNSIARMKQNNVLKRVRPEIDSIQNFFLFMSTNFLAGNQKDHFGGIYSNVSAPAAQPSARQERIDSGAYLKSLLTVALYSLSDDWQLDAASNLLEKTLTAYKAGLSKKEMERKALWTTYFSGTVAQLFSVLFFCFMIMVIADYLKAHFDMAEAVKGKQQ